MEMKGNKRGESLCNKAESSVCYYMKEMVFAEILMAGLAANDLV